MADRDALRPLVELLVAQPAPLDLDRVAAALAGRWELESEPVPGRRELRLVGGALPAGVVWRAIAGSSGWRLAKVDVDPRTLRVNVKHMKAWLGRGEDDFRLVSVHSARGLSIPWHEHAWNVDAGRLWTKVDADTHEVLELGLSYDPTPLL